MEYNYTHITNKELDREIQQTLNVRPCSRETYVTVSLKGSELFKCSDQQFRIRESLKRIDGVGRGVRHWYAICRRTYNVTGPNHLWHIDSNHKLISWRFVIHGCIDG